MTLEHFSLQGLRILSTRPQRQGDGLNVTIAAAGGQALNCPALAIVPSQTSWFSLLPNLHKVKHAIFTSSNAALFSMPQLTSFWLNSIQVTAIGKGTAAALIDLDVRVDHIPSPANSEQLLALPGLQQVDNEIILLFKGEGGRTLIAEILKKRGAQLIELNVYRRILPIFNQQELDSWWQNKAVDIILFTSQQAMQNLFTMFSKQTHSWLQSLPCLVISHRLANAASLLGMKYIVTCSPETIIKTLSQFNQGLIHGNW